MGDEAGRSRPANPDGALEQLLRQRRARPHVVRADRSGPLALSPLQEGMWFESQLDPDSRAMNLYCAFPLPDPLNEDALVRSILAIVERHEILRSVFRAVDEAPVQVVTPTSSFTVPLLDLRGIGPDELTARFTEFGNAPFDVERGPLFRTTVVRHDERNLLWVNAHHLVFDGASFPIFLRELEALYPALAEGRAPSLPSLPLQYADCAATHRAHLAQAHAEQDAFWQRALEGARYTRIPADVEPSATNGLTGAVTRFLIEPEVGERIDQLSRTTKSTLFSTLFSAFIAVLARWTGERDLLVSVPVNNRSIPGSRLLIGTFVNLVPVRTHVPDELTFEQLASGVRANLLAAFGHADIPLAAFVPGTQRTFANPTLRRILFSCDPSSADLVLGGPAVTNLRSESAAFVPGFEIAFRLNGSVQTGLTGFVGYDGALYSQQLIEALVESFKVVLAAAATRADQRITELPMMTERSRQRVLVERNATSAAYPRDRCLHELFEARARETPEAVALRCGDRAVTFRALSVASDRVAASLRERGACTGARVWIRLDHSPALVIAVLGVLKVGGVYVPRDIEPSGSRTGAPAFIVTAGAPTGSGSDEEVVFDIEASASASTPRDPRAPTCGDAACELLSSSARAAVVLSHRSIVNAVTQTVRVLSISERDATWLAAPASSAVSLLEMFAPLLAGATLVIPPHEGRDDRGSLVAFAARSGVTVLSTTPSLLGGLLEEPSFHPWRELRIAWCVGEEGLGALPRRFVERARCPLIGIYGPPEATGCAALQEYRSPEAERPRVVGRPFANTALFTLDAAGQPAPVGVVGELYVAGGSAALGYRDLPEVSAERFVPNPFSPDAGARMYRTGERARWTSDGQLEYLGRGDALSAVQSEVGETPPPGAGAGAPYAVPRNPIERALVAIWCELLGVERVGLHDDFFELGGHSLLALRLVGRVRAALGLELSIRAVFETRTLASLAAKLAALGHAGHRSVERPGLGMAPALLSQVASDPTATRRTRLPPALRGVFKLDKLSASSEFARHVRSVWIDGPLEIESLERALATMRTRHAALRTRFFEVDKLEMLEVLDPEDVACFPLLERADLSALSGEPQAAADEEFHQRVAYRPLDLGRGEVISVGLTTLSPNRHRLTVSLHNIVSDAESMGVYASELCELWREPTAALPPIPLQLHHLADYLERMRDSEAGLATRAFWQARVEGIQPLQLPIDAPREEVDARREASGGVVRFRAGSVTSVIPREAVAALERIAERQRASVMSTLVAAMAAYLSQRTSQRDIALITRLSHRYLPGLERTLGFLVSPLLLRISTEGEPAFPELVARTHTVVTDAFDHGECDLFELAPYHVFRFCLVYLPAPVLASSEGAVHLPNGSVVTAAPVPRASVGGQIGYDLLLWLTHDRDRVGLTLAYNLELFREATAAAFLDGFVDYVSATCASGAASLPSSQ